MRSVFFTCLVVVFVLAFENVNAQYDSNYYYRRYSRNQRPVVIISSRSGIRRRYVPPTVAPIKEDVDSQTHQDVKKVRLDIYYATDCPDSMRFITRQLHPLYQEMEDVLDINLVPYGKAQESYDADNQKYDFRCQHGPLECYGNTVQSCAMSLYPNKKDYMEFINCMEAYARPSRNGNKCARRLSLDWQKIDKCAKGDEGNRLLHEMAQQTVKLNPPLYFIPWIVVDGVFTESNQRTGLRNLRGVVCDTYKGNHTSCQS